MSGPSLRIAVTTLTGGVVGVFLLASPGAAIPTAVGSPHIASHPNTVMAKASIKLIGTHFKPLSTFTIRECSQSTWVVTQDVCVIKNSIVVKTNANGKFTGSFTAYRCPAVRRTPPTGHSQTCYIGDPTPEGIDVITLLGAATIMVTRR
jgi:hypothetical protein